MSEIDGWTKGEHTASGVTHPTYRKGSGPGVVVISEIPGITEDVIAFSEEVVALGFTVVMPHLFGKVPSPDSPVAVLGTLRQVCVNREFNKMRLHADLADRGLAALASPATCTPSSVGPASARSACASPAGSRWR